MIQSKRIASALALSMAAMLGNLGCLAETDGESANAADVAAPVANEAAGEAREACCLPGWAGCIPPFLTIGPLSYSPCGCPMPFFAGGCGCGFGFGGGF
jgi:hypothetical protein